MTAPLLLKGFEVEMYTGRADGSVVGCSAEVAAELEGFVIEPDQRNLEYTTAPDRDYSRQLALILEPRRRLRHWLAPRGLTILPGSTLSLGDSTRFERANPGNPYHAFIERTYGTRVVTASVHLNFGMTDMEPLFAGLRLLRCEAALLLAMSASSPFLDGRATGAHSQRWLQFPLTPLEVPLFRDHQHYIRWMEEQLEIASMFSVRHFWSSVRPNGEDRPHSLNRLEVRICDLISDPLLLLAVTAFAELRLQQLLADPGGHDPLVASALDEEQLAELADSNDRAAALSSLDADLRHWRTGETIEARRWMAEELQAMAPLAEAMGLSETLKPLESVVTEGNQALRWLDRHRMGASIGAIIAAEATELARQEQALKPRLAPHPPSVLG